MRNFRKYDIWLDGMEFVNEVYSFTEDFPKDERYGLISQMQRCAVSIPSNIAEGASRSSEKDFARFLEISIGSSFELETQIRIAVKRKYIKLSLSVKLIEQLISLQKRMAALRTKVLSS